MSDLDLAAIKARAEKVTLGGNAAAGFNSAFDVPALVAEVERLTAENDQLRRDLLAETYRPEGGEIVMRELGQVRAERDALKADVDQLNRRLFPSQGENYANEVERQRAVIDQLQQIAEKLAAERDALLSRLDPDNEEVVELVAKVDYEGGSGNWEDEPPEGRVEWLNDARRILSALRSLGEETT